MAIERVGEDPRGWKFASTMLETKHSKGLKAGMQMSRRGRPRKRMLAVCRLRRQWASCHYVRRILKPHRVVLLCLLSRWWQATLCIRSATGPRLLSAHLIIRKSSARCQYTPLPPTSSVTLSTLSTPFPYLSLSLRPVSCPLSCPMLLHASSLAKFRLWPKGSPVQRVIQP